MKDNLVITTRTSDTKPIAKISNLQEIQDLLQEKLQQAATVVIWQANAILFGKWEKGTLQFAHNQAVIYNLIQEIRAFSENAEIHLVKQGNILTGRYIEDGIGIKSEAVDSIARLWGEKVTSDAVGFVKLLDKTRKISLYIPVEDNNHQYYGLVTRSYIGYDDSTGQAGYKDYRLVKIVAAGRE